MTDTNINPMEQWYSMPLDESLQLFVLLGRERLKLLKKRCYLIQVFERVQYDFFKIKFIPGQLIDGLQHLRRDQVFILIIAPEFILWLVTDQLSVGAFPLFNSIPFKLSFSVHFDPSQKLTH